jgi:hypothetical protein
MNDVSNPGPAASSVVSPAPSDPPPPERKRYVWLRRSALVLGLALLFVAAATFIQRWTKAPSAASETRSVIEQWKATMMRIGLEPVYPPNEDVFVGDIYVVVTWDNDVGEKSPLIGKSVNVARIDMTKELEKAYRSGYSFPDTLPKPQTEGTPWPQKAAPASIFAPAVERKHLPLVVLPGFTIARVRQASAGGGWLSGAFSALGAVEGAGESTIELKIPNAETYGVPSLVAGKYLEDFCKDTASRGVCTQQGARNELLSNVGSEVTDLVKCPDPAKDPCRKDYRLDIEILLINRVYMTRSIETVTRDSSSFGAQAKVAAKVSEELRQMQAAAPPAPAPNAPPAEVDAARRALEAHKTRLDALAAQLSAAPGAAASLHSSDANSVGITQTLLRPVVIGYRAFKQTPAFPKPPESTGDVK